MKYKMLADKIWSFKLSDYRHFCGITFHLIIANLTNIIDHLI